jgi:hypothetical protein
MTFLLLIVIDSDYFEGCWFNAKRATPAPERRHLLITDITTANIQRGTSHPH